VAVATSSILLKMMPLCHITANQDEFMYPRLGTMEPAT